MGNSQGKPVDLNGEEKEIREEELYRSIERDFQPFDYTVAAYNKLAAMQNGEGDAADLNNSAGPAGENTHGQAMSVNTAVPAMPSNGNPSQYQAQQPQQQHTDAQNRGHHHQGSRGGPARPPPLPPYPNSYAAGHHRSQPSGMRVQSPTGGIQMTIDAAGSWSQLARQDATLPADANTVPDDKSSSSGGGVFSIFGRKRAAVTARSRKKGEFWARRAHELLLVDEFLHIRLSSAHLERAGMNDAVGCTTIPYQVQSITNFPILSNYERWILGLVTDNWPTISAVLGDGFGATVSHCKNNETTAANVACAPQTCLNRGKGKSIISPGHTYFNRYKNTTANSFRVARAAPFRMGLAGFSRLGLLQPTVHPLELLKHSERRFVTVGLSGVELAAEPVWSLLKPTAQVEWIYGPLGLAYRYEESGEVNASGTVAVLDCRSLRSPVGYLPTNGTTFMPMRSMIQTNPAKNMCLQMICVRPTQDVAPNTPT
ncbi:AGC/YANK protein kinase [Apiospora sp. TS-2023a]